MKERLVVFLLMFLSVCLGVASSLAAGAEDGQGMKKSPPKAPPGMIAGQVEEKADKSGMETGMVAFFDADRGLPPGPGAGRRIPDMRTKLRRDGSFTASLPAGRYYIGVILGRDEKKAGPPGESERSFVAFGEDGAPRIFTVKSGDIIHAGVLSGQIPDLAKLPQPSRFTVKGKVTGPDGKPLGGAKVIAMEIEPDRLHPVYTVLGTGEDGSYALRLGTGTSYIISVRSGLGGGQPTPGEFVGRYGGDDPRPVTGTSGEVVDGVDIQVFRIPEPGESGQKALKKPDDAKDAKPMATQEK